MRRVFGSAPTAPKATLDDSVTALESRRSKIEVSIKAKENEIAELNRRRAATRSAVAQNALKTKALRILRRMKEDEAQMNNVQSQIDNLQKMQDMQGTLKNSAVMVDTMRQTQKELKKQYGKFDIDKIEKMQDEMADLLDMSNEIQESLSRGYDVGEDIDEADLEAELDAIGEEVEFEREMGVGGAVPSFLEDEVPDFIDEPPVVEKKVQEAAR
ncbi:charged multivesicular body protein 5 [Pyricularia oryzae 70-15]|uniref:Charged multivesicular body protein 5 n=3 Tax=Pyricularia oryzae TaxID=318829 RepID=G4NAK3_PYRO7|nr:charged multivesicular body protein 5 [Pyricularia oryzae 70-15]EHA51341.1 charged multivesicular body protein 5 [Pyricularia oryzae 70-15]ELQ33116.1 charged multivesicular body protein 5 [Pyricularia oryzae Y34]KAI7919806.1 charged multivesicular body protein 5 [Pyricularia oryzae]KAI7920221.1 charged multivesicular body protein 5 [Pyricularia oryzae]